ncbi:MAG: nucleoside deaminase [Deltaproteobacteria bacterium]|nr:nucleoside deaminase [Deltaproteobacteria bacterium]
MLDHLYMSLALDEARLAWLADEIPVGAVAVSRGRVIARGRNRKEEKGLALSHAEIEVITAASLKLGDWRLSEVTLYVTLEPCIMCTGALLQARIGRVVYGCPDPKGGALDSLYQLADDPRLNHSFPVRSGVFKDQAAALLQVFFRNLRKNQKG